MNWLRELARRLRMLMNRRQFDAELEEEMRLHLELREQENLASGIATEDVARTAARRRFGNAIYLKEESHIAWGWDWFEHLAQDVRYGLRMLRKSPGFTAIAVLTIAVGIGATTAIFSVVDATLLHPLPYPQPDQLVSIVDDLPGIGVADVGLNRPEWQDLQHSGIFEYVSPAWYDENNLTGASKPATVRLVIVAPDYFALLRLKPQLGRIFNPENDRPGFTMEVVISDGLWERLFGRDPRILEKSIRLDTDLYRIVGVMPRDFHAPGRTRPERNIEVWAATTFYGPPLLYNPPRNRRNIPGAIARLKPGVTLAAAQSRVDALVASLQKQFPVDYPARDAWRIRLVPLKETVVGNVRESLILLLAAVGLVLLIGCVNVANLLLARSSARGREIALRQVLGAARGRLVRQLLTESLLLSLLGGIGGLAILLSMKGLLLRLVPESLPRLGDISINCSVLVFAVAASLAAGVIFGLAPALQTSRLGLTHALKQEGRGSTGSDQQARTRRALVVTEFAVSLVLMSAACLLLHSFWELLNVRPGFNPENVMAVRTRLPYPNNSEIDKYATASQEAPFIRELVRRFRVLPGVDEVALGNSGAIPLDQSQQDLNVVAEGQFFLLFEGRGTQSDQPTRAERCSITPEYFHLLGIPLLRGRFFAESDNENAPQVAVINEAMARTFWPNESPLGKRFKQVRAGSQWVTVVGVIADARTESLAEASAPQIYLNLYQTGGKHLAVFLRGHLDTAAIPGEVREQVQAVDPTLPVFGAQKLEEVRSASLSERRFSMEVVGLFALTALLLAGIGIYGVISYIVGERTHEFGIRLALGAQQRDVMQMVLRQGLSLAVTGAGIGLAAGLVVSHLIAGLLYAVKPTDPLTFAAVALFLVGVATLACYIPARKATSIDPMMALRHE